MPWTFSHPAAVLPLRSLGLPLPALVVGSLAPDFGYYVGLFALATHAHSFAGLLTTCLPGGLLALWLARALRTPVVEWLPQPHRGALARLTAPGDAGTTRRFVMDATAIVLGATTHVLWDGATHARGLFVAAAPALARPWEFAGIAAPAYAWLQHASTLIGAAVLAIAYGRWLRRQPPSPPHSRAGEARRHVAWLGAVSLAVAIAVAWVAWRHPHASLAPRLFRIAVLAPMLLLGAAIALAVVRRRFGNPGAGPRRGP
jgi:hypothetical protein